MVSQWTGIPLKKMLETEVGKTAQYGETAGKKGLWGQDQALSLISDSVRRARAEISDPNCPVGSFIFLGPTGGGQDRDG